MHLPETVSMPSTSRPPGVPGPGTPVPGLCDFCRWKPRGCWMADSMTAVERCFEARQAYREKHGAYDLPSEKKKSRRCVCRRR